MTPRPAPGPPPAHGHAEGRQIPFAQPGSRTRPLLIASGKGGVGKSSVTTNLAVALAQQGHSVGVIDADVYGFSIPRMLGTDREPVVIDQMLIPPERWGVRCISMGYFVPEGQAVIWRGPMLHKALEQFLTDVFWDDPEFLLVDMPPGTGDIALSLSQYLPRAEVLVVTTPQPAAQKVARLSAAMAEKVHLPVKGVIENMSWFTGDDGTRYELFGAGGGQELADELGVPLLAQLPLVMALREGGDSGRPITAVDPDSEVGGQLPPDGRAHRRRAGSPQGLQPPAAHLLSVPRRRPAQARPIGTRRAISRLTSRSDPTQGVSPVDVRIGITQAARELLVELADDTDRDELRSTVSAALAGAVDTLVLTDRRGREILVPSAKIAYVEVGVADGERRMGFGG